MGQPLNNGVKGVGLGRDGRRGQVDGLRGTADAPAGGFLISLTGACRLCGDASAPGDLRRTLAKSSPFVQYSSSRKYYNLPLPNRSRAGLDGSSDDC